MKNSVILLAILALIGAVVAYDGLFIVDEKEQAIVTKLGEPKRTIGEPGLHFKLPFVESVSKLDKRILSLDLIPQEVLDADQYRLLVDSFARFRIEDPLKTFTAVRTEDRALRRLSRILDAAVREVLAKHKKESIISGRRSELMEEIQRVTNAEAGALGLEVLDVRLKRVDLPAENSRAIFDRMISERNREAEQRRAEGTGQALEITSGADRDVAVLLAEARKTSAIIRGEGDAEAVRIFAEAFSQDEEFFEFYRTMQAYRKSLGKDDTRLVLSPNSEFFKLLLDEQSK